MDRWAPDPEAIVPGPCGPLPARATGTTRSPSARGDFVSSAGHEAPRGCQHSGPGLQIRAPTSRTGRHWPEGMLLRRLGRRARGPRVERSLQRGQLGVELLLVEPTRRSRETAASHLVGSPDARGVRAVREGVPLFVGCLASKEDAFVDRAGKIDNGALNVGDGREAVGPA